MIDTDRAARGWYVDAACYAASTLFALLVWVVADIPLQRRWAEIAIWSYLVAVPTALALARTRPRHGPRLVLAVAVMIGAAVVPLAMAAADRGPDDRGATAQSEVLIVEEAATSLLGGRNPYVEAFDRGPLAGRPEPTRTHVPYPPGMLVFGVPRAVVGPGPLSDARVWFLVASLVIAVPAIRRMRTDDDGRLLVAQTMFVLPTGAMPIATGGHDVPVVALLLASLVLADAGSTTRSGLVAGGALALRQTTLLVLPFLAAIVPSRRRLRHVVVALLPAALLSLPFLAWDAGAFLEDVVRFPLVLGTGPSAARTPTVGSILLDLAPDARVAVTTGLTAAIVWITLALVAIGTPRTAAPACRRAALAYVAAIVLAPAARVGYLLYPISLLVWSFAFARGEREREAVVTATVRASP
jgi:hypothetical protein